MDISRNPFTVVIEDDTETTIEFTGAILPKLLEAPRQSMYFKVTAQVKTLHGSQTKKVGSL
jgi:hypothetical protein